ncbi:DgyrCDS13548 [Dimorphilus gyrociliatus]|uniref:DgyrCDS13548 n=1 Tax=Dimorphilus gyrociliatus TaxID=2664684 RepID=A0A7I8WAY3_9ANNE|nr:DgyrCDS13548 [Dimorphilus gyrociliatus]
MIFAFIKFFLLLVAINSIRSDDGENLMAEKRDLQMLRMGKRYIGDLNDEQKRTLHILRQRSPLPRLGERAPLPRLGERAPLPRLGLLRAAPLPRLGLEDKRVSELDWNEFQEDSRAALPRLGYRAAPLPRLGKEKRDVKLLRMGKRGSKMLQLGKKDHGMLQLGKRQMLRMG